MNMRHLFLCLSLLLSLMFVPVRSHALSISPASDQVSEPFELTYGFEVLGKKQSTIHAFHSLTLRHDIGRGFTFGQTLYSAATGDGGGLFIGGVELAKRWSLGRNTLEFSGFIGGGGGAAQVSGDGLMLRGAAALYVPIARDFTVYGGIGYVHVTGSAISTPSFNFGLTRAIGFNLSGPRGSAATGGISFRAIKPHLRAFIPLGSKNRSGARTLNTMYLPGAELTFGREGVAETFITASGAAAGDGEGFAEWQLGRRWHAKIGAIRAFGEASAGFAGGGDVDTGGGVVVSAGGGLAIPIGRAFELEFGATGIAAVEGGFAAISPFLRGSFAFAGTRGRDPSQPSRKWQISTGATVQIPHTGYRKSSKSDAIAPVLMETNIDIFLTERVYFMGSAQTVMLGDAGGYAVGLMGAGYELPLSRNWFLSGELHVGAAGGGGVQTLGGLMAGGRLELDYALPSGARISGGVGYLQTIRSGVGAKPVTVQLGVKLPFRTHY